jgi:hypothetical protein
MCDALVALAGATGSFTRFAKSSDRPPHEAQDLVWSAPRRDEGEVRATHISIPADRRDTLGVLASRPRWCWGVEHGVNEAAVAIGNASIFTTLDPHAFPPALTGLDLVRFGLERGRSAVEALDVMTVLLEQFGQGGACQADGHPYWSSFVVADADTAWVLETSGREWEVEEVDRVRAISNRTSIPAFDAAHRHPRQPVATLVDPRWRASQRVLAQQPVTMESLAAHLRSHDGPDGWSVCMHVGVRHTTTASMIAELPGSTQHPRAWCLLGSPCRSIYVPVTVGEELGPVPAWERFAALRDDDAGALRELEVRLHAEAVPAPEAWRMVDEVLTALGR